MTCSSRSRSNRKMLVHPARTARRMSIASGDPVDKDADRREWEESCANRRPGGGAGSPVASIVKHPTNPIRLHALSRHVAVHPCPPIPELRRNPPSHHPTHSARGIVTLIRDSHRKKMQHESISREKYVATRIGVSNEHAGVIGRSRRFVMRARIRGIRSPPQQPRSSRAFGESLHDHVGVAGCCALLRADRRRTVAGESLEMHAIGEQTRNRV